MGVSICYHDKICFVSLRNARVRRIGIGLCLCMVSFPFSFLGMILQRPCLFNFKPSAGY